MSSAQGVCIGVIARLVVGRSFVGLGRCSVRFVRVRACSSVVGRCDAPLVAVTHGDQVGGTTGQDTLDPRTNQGPDPRTKNSERLS
jgi:hypothetical protein